MSSHNGIATVANENRRLIFGEVFRVRRSGGVFSFSTHNLSSRNRPIGFSSGQSLSRQPTVLTC